MPILPPARRRLRGDRGAVAAELALAVPLLMLLLTGVVQFALAEHAHHIAQNAAARALAAARSDGGSAGTGQAAAQRELAGTAGRVLQRPSVSVTRGQGTVTVRVSGVADPVFPGLRLKVTAVDSGPVERVGQ